ncbi:MAG: amino acid permease [Spirochaetes bacterium]|nr:amino acid permease [Spirochaetota bacterium]
MASHAPGTAAPAPALSRELNLFQLVMMGVGMMIGAGAVIGMGLSVKTAGPGGVIVAFALDGVVALFTAMAYAEMSSAVPKAGSIYNFARIAVGRATGFSAGWIAWFASAVAGSFYAVILSEYTVELLARLGLLAWLPLDEYWTVRLVAVACAALFALINYRGVSSTGMASSFLTLGQTATLVFIGFFGLVVFLLDPSRIANFKPFLPHGWSGIFVCMGVEYIAFEGYEVIAEAGDEALQPRRNLPKAIIYSVLIVTVTYVLVAFGLIAGVRGVEGPAWEWLAGFGEKGFGEAMQKLMPLGSYMAFLTVLFAATSALNATIFSAARVSYALGRDRMLPGVLGKISAKRSTPHVALAASSVLLVAGIFLPITDLASAASIMFLFLFLLANVCVLRMRRRLGGEMQYGYLMPLFPLVPLAAIVLQLVLAIFIVNVSWLAWVIGPGWIAVGMLIYFLYARGRALPIREEVFAVDAPVVPSDGRFRILVPVADTDQVLPLVPLMLRLAEASDGGVELVHLVTVPDQVPLSDAHRYAAPGTEGEVEASLYLPARRLVNSSVLYCRNPARGILYQARAGRANLILLGWRGRASAAGRLFGSTLDQVLERATCDVAVIRSSGRAPFLNVLVPVAGGPNSERALEIAGLLADPKKGLVTALHVRTARSEPLDIAALITKVCRESSMSCERFSGRVVTSDDPRAVILREAAGADLIVLGATEGRFRRLVAATLPGDIARSCDRPLVIVRTAGRRHRPRAG